MVAGGAAEARNGISVAWLKRGWPLRLCLWEDSAPQKLLVIFKHFFY